MLSLGALVGGAAAQSTTTAALPSFDVVSVRKFQYTGRPWHRAAAIDPQRLYIQGMAPVELINLAWSLNRNQLTGLPRWAQYSEDSLYSITATTSKPTSKAQMLLMLRRVLVERFQLKLSIGDKVQPVYDLEVAPGGPKLTPLPPGEDCAKAMDAVPPPAERQMLTLLYRGCSLPDLIARLNIPAPVLFFDRPVIDRTRLTGNYVIVLYRRLARPVQIGQKVVFGEPVAEALQRQLGLVPVKAVGPYRMYSVTHIARPGPDQ
jgi:uncharacterized protein (TIGR03435 family)